MTTPKLHGHDTTLTDEAQFARAPVQARFRARLLLVLIAGLFVMSPGPAVAEPHDYGYSYYGAVTPDKDKPSNATGRYDPFAGGSDPFGGAWYDAGTWSGDIQGQWSGDVQGEWLSGEPLETDGSSQGAGLSWLPYLVLAALLTLIWWRHITVSIKTSWQTAKESFSTQFLLLAEDKASRAGITTLMWRITKLFALPPAAFFWVLAGAPELQRLWRSPSS